MLQGAGRTVREAGHSLQEAGHRLEVGHRMAAGEDTLVVVGNLGKHLGGPRMAAGVGTQGRQGGELRREEGSTVVELGMGKGQELHIPAAGLHQLRGRAA